MRRLFSLEPFSLSFYWFPMNMMPDCSLNASIGGEEAAGFDGPHLGIL